MKTIVFPKAIKDQVLIDEIDFQKDYFFIGLTYDNKKYITIYQEDDPIIRLIDKKGIHIYFYDFLDETFADACKDHEITIAYLFENFKESVSWLMK